MTDTRQAPKTRLKDPDAVLDFGFRYHLWLQTAETIVDSDWDIETTGTLAVQSSNINVAGNTTTVWLTGGEAGVQYLVRNTITTSEGRVDQRTLLVRVMNR